MAAAYLTNRSKGDWRLDHSLSMYLRRMALAKLRRAMEGRLGGKSDEPCRNLTVYSYSKCLIRLDP